jgi:hypothetical protein
MRQLAELCRRFEPALLIQDGIDVGALGIDNGFIGHDENLDAEEYFSCRKKGHEIAGVYSTQRRAGCD